MLATAKEVDLFPHGACSVARHGRQRITRSRRWHRHRSPSVLHCISTQRSCNMTYERDITKHLNLANPGSPGSPLGM